MSFFPGLPHPPRGLLARYFPPLAEGVAAEYAARWSRPGDLLFDPFGQSAQLALEAALTGRRLLLNNFNPVARFALRFALDPVPEPALRAALTRLGDTRIANERTEVHVQNLYRTRCPDCGATVTVDYFEWEREAGAPVAKVYYCPTEGAVLARPAGPDDAQAAAGFPARSLNYYWALERATPAGDPAREHAAAALAAYTPRALHTLALLVHRFEALGPAGEERRALEALLLAAFDEAASLWPPAHDPHFRPRTVHPPARFREFNPWRALENAAGGLAGAGAPVRLCALEELLAGAAAPEGAVCLSEGSARAVAGRLPPGSARLALTLLPRPNPAFWGLSALWASWLWGRAAAGPIKAVMRHKRTDFDWHEQGLRRALAAVRPALQSEARLAGLLPEAEAGLVEAVVTALDGAGFALDVSASSCRADPPELQGVWRVGGSASGKPTPQETARAIQRAAVEACRALLLARGEAARWTGLHAGVWLALAGRRLLARAVAAAPDDPLGLAAQAIAAGMQADSGLRRLEAEPEAAVTEGAWWVRDARDAAEPLADRVEHAIWELLAAEPAVEEPEAEAAACETAGGAPALAPGRRLVRACLASYGVETPEGKWTLRPEDAPEARAADLREVAGLLGELGDRLGYQARTEGDQVDWRESDQLRYSFVLMATAALGSLLRRPALAQAHRPFIVLPGGRAGLAAFKLQRDARLAEAARARDWQYLKFRHVRRLAAEQGLDRARLDAMLGLDPVLEKAAAQIPLL